MSRQRNKTGIFYSNSDKVQPYRVWLEGYIIWFAKTQQEAELKLRKAERRKLTV